MFSIFHSLPLRSFPVVLLVLLCSHTRTGFAIAFVFVSQTNEGIVRIRGSSSNCRQISAEICIRHFSTEVHLKTIFSYVLDSCDYKTKSLLNLQFSLPQIAPRNFRIHNAEENPASFMNVFSCTSPCTFAANQNDTQRNRRGKCNCLLEENRVRGLA